MNNDNHLISEAYKTVREQTFNAKTGEGTTARGDYYRITPGPVPPANQHLRGFFAAGAPAKASPGYLAVGRAPISTPDGGNTIDINADVLFGFDQKTIQNNSPGMKTINGLIRKLVEAVPQLGNKKYTVTVHGHTDLYELKPGYNQSLSQERAQFVAMLLQAGASSSLGGQDPYIFKFQGHGSSQPKIKDLPYPIQGGKAPEEGRAQQAPNRRVSLTFNPPLPEPAKRLIITDIPKEPSYNRIGETPRPQQGQVLGAITQ